MASKGKGIAIDGYGSSGKRKRADNDKNGRSQKNPGVLQFFEDAADVDDVDDVSESSEEDIYYDEEFWEEEFGLDINTNNAGKGAQLPVFPKEEQLSEDELDKMMEERYKPGAGFVTFAEDRCNKGTMERNTIVPSAEDPTVWKVKCVVGRERISSFCLMQKYIDLRSMGTSKLRIISAFALDHVKGFIFIEAEKQCDIYEACLGLCNIYAGRSAPIPKNDVSHLLCVRTKSSEISVGTWARVKSGRYKGDLAQIFAVNDGRKKATVKLIPRIDLQALGQKFGGGARVKNSAIPPPRLLSSSELEEFKPLIQIRKDRDTGKEFEFLDGMLLKDGYLYKKVPIDSLSLWGVLPTEEELLKFETPARNDELKDLEWLSKLYGDEKKPRRNPVINDKGGGKGEGSSSSMENSIEVHDLVIHGRKGFGVIIGMEKDETYRVLKEGTKGSMVVTAKQRELKKASLDKKFNAFDHNKKTISLNDTVRILEGPSENKIGIVKQIYRGTIFVHDENETQDGGYFCSKAEMCEKVKPSTGSSFEKGGGSGFTDFEQDPVSSPKALAMDNNRSFSRDDNNSDDMFSIGQSLRIKVGPLKGYLCKVLAVRRSDVTVKLDSQHKILTVKSDLLSEVREKTVSVSTSDDPNSEKPFGLLGTGDGPGGWLDGAGTSADAGGWNTGGASGWGSANPSNAGDNDADKDAGDWGKKVEAPSDDSSWGKKAPEADSEQVGGWGQSSNDAAAAPTNDGWGSGAAKTTNDDTWGNKGKSVVESSTSSGWGNAAAAAAKETTEPAWGKPADVATDTGGWGSNPKKDDSAADTGGWGNTKKDDSAADTGGWGNPKKDDSAADTGGWGNASDKGKEAESTWGKAAGGTESKNEGWGNSKKDVEDSVGGGGWGQASGGDAAASGGSAWGKKDDGGGSAWGKKDDGGGSSWGNSGGGSSWGKPSGGGSTWGADDADQSNGGGRGRGRGGGGGRGSGCFKCGEEGHMSRECPSGGRGGGRGGGGGSCFKCGEEGHFSRECPNGGGGGGGRGGGGNCYKCGEEGHISRECPSSGGGGRGGGRGRGCFKCGEEGHISRECPNGGGGVSWNSSSQEGRGSWSSGGGGGGWGSKPEASSDGGAGGGGAGGWGSKPEAASDGGAGGGGGWGSKSVAASDGAAANEAGGGWGSKAKASDDVMKLSDGAEGSVLGKPPSDTGGSSWGKPPPATGGGGSSWGKPEADSTGGSSWGPTNATVEGSSWGKPASDSGGSSWGKPQSDGGGSSWGGGGGGGAGGRGGRGRGCFKCGEEGHMSMECPSGGGRGRGCFKCGEEGHMSRECPSGGGGGRGGGGCYKCGENGHFARECPTS